jgi:hypothetical protein
VRLNVQVQECILEAGHISIYSNFPCVPSFHNTDGKPILPGIGKLLHSGRARIRLSNYLAFSRTIAASSPYTRSVGNRDPGCWYLFSFVMGGISTSREASYRCQTKNMAPRQLFMLSLECRHAIRAGWCSLPVLDSQKYLPALFPTILCDLERSPGRPTCIHILYHSNDVSVIYTVRESVSSGRTLGWVQSMNAAADCLGSQHSRLRLMMLLRSSVCWITLISGP